MIEPLKYLGVFLAWNLVAGATLLFLPAPVGLAPALLLSAALLWGYLLPSGHAEGAARRWAALRLRPLRGDALRWTLAAVPVLLLLTWSLGEVYTRLVPVPGETLNPFASLADDPWGRLSIAVFAVAVAPILEEFFFRGLIQRALERRWGTGPGIIGAAAVFASIHLLPWVFPLHLFLGAAFGFAVVATRSIWAGVILHAANNALAMLGLQQRGEAAARTPTLWETGPTGEWWASLALLLVSGALALGVGRGLWRAGRGPRLRGPARHR